jgi:hypothetical protein
LSRKKWLIISVVTIIVVAILSIILGYYYYYFTILQRLPEGVDEYGIKKIYFTKPGGEAWSMNRNNPNSDPRFHIGSIKLIKNRDGSFKVTSTEVRFGVYTSSGYQPDKISTLNQQQLASKGYMQLANDWKNVEMTGYFKINSFTDSIHNGPPHIELLARGGIHTNSIRCEGTSYHSNLYETGRSKFEKELEFTAGYTTEDPEKQYAETQLQGKWIGIKAIFYNKNDGTVNLEQWIDDGFDSTNTPRNNWHKIFEFTDTGNWRAVQNYCGGTSNTIIKWGGPIAIFRWDNIDDMDFKNFSVREIQPPQSLSS